MLNSQAAAGIDEVDKQRIQHAPVSLKRQSSRRKNLLHRSTKMLLVKRGTGMVPSLHQRSKVLPGHFFIAADSRRRISKQFLAPPKHRSQSSGIRSKRPMCRACLSVCCMFVVPACATLVLARFVAWRGKV